MSYTGFLPCSLFPVPCSLFPAPCSLLPKIYNESTSPNSIPLYYSYLNRHDLTITSKSNDLTMESKILEFFAQ
ncbi:MAG: hypothetical protein F6J90_33050 [Moorea sp. SIOASIH]|uniref:hypothetical protein n=1 Tax=Moorena sp. SIOASIH TaxID=2607817 RepID=UPI0013BAFD0A|nr:hypothetical protein [Moorena sp. SIOASIH]NEO40903.1 hypothetical protein [Moorena sp. SIOASIH]